MRLFYLPNCGCNTRLLAVSLVLTVGFTVTFLTWWSVGAFLSSLPVPDGMVPGDWAMLRLYLAFGSELLMLMLMVVASFVGRRKLDRQRSSRTPLS